MAGPRAATQSAHVSECHAVHLITLIMPVQLIDPPQTKAINPSMLPQQQSQRKTPVSLVEDDFALEHLVELVKEHQNFSGSMRGRWEHIRNMYFASEVMKEYRTVGAPGLQKKYTDHLKQLQIRSAMGYVPTKACEVVMLELGKHDKATSGERPARKKRTSTNRRKSHSSSDDEEEEGEVAEDDDSASDDDEEGAAASHPTDESMFKEESPPSKAIEEDERQPVQSMAGQKRAVDVGEDDEEDDNMWREPPAKAAEAPPVVKAAGNARKKVGSSRQVSPPRRNAPQQPPPQPLPQPLPLHLPLPSGSGDHPAASMMTIPAGLNATDPNNPLAVAAMLQLRIADRSMELSLQECKNAGKAIELQIQKAEIEKLRMQIDFQKMMTAAAAGSSHNGCAPN